MQVTAIENRLIELENGKGFFLGLKLSSSELSLLRSLIQKQWLNRIQQNVSPELYEAIKDTEIDQYHTISDQLDHKALWPKAERILSEDDKEIVKGFGFYQELKNLFGDISIANEEEIYSEEVYWRLVRPNASSDIGPMHADKWFWDLGYGKTPEGHKRVKIWMAIFCEPGLNGLSFVPHSQKKEFTFSRQVRDGMVKPAFDESQYDLNPEVFQSDPGEMAVFHDRCLHKGILNNGKRTRVSLEMTIFVKE